MGQAEKKPTGFVEERQDSVGLAQVAQRIYLLPVGEGECPDCETSSRLL